MADTVSVFDQFDEAPIPAPGAPNAPQTQVVQGRPMSTVGALPQPTEDDQAAAASGARESAGRTPRRRAQQETTSGSSTKPTAEGASVFDQFDGDPKDDGVALMERLRLNRQDAYYRGSLAGSIGLAALAHVYKTPDAPDLPPERKAVNRQQREQYLKIVADLAAHDQMESWGTTLEAGAAFAGQLEGSMISPESWVGWAAKGATWVARAARSGLQQGAIQAATDPVVQGLNISADVQQEPDYLRPFIAAAAGFGIGAVGHAGAEGAAKVAGQLQTRKILYDLGKEDPSFSAPREAEWALNPDNGIQAPVIERPGLPEAPEPRAAAAPETGEPRAEAAPAPEEPRYQPGPEHGFDDAVKAERIRLRNSYGAAQPKSARMGDEARFSAFHDEVGDILDAKVAEHQLDPDSVRYGDIWKFYERAPGEPPEEALERATLRWASEEERRGIQSPADDAQLQRDLDEWARAYDSEMERMAGYDQEIDVSTQMPSRAGGPGRGSTNRTLPGVSTIFRDYRPAHLPEEDIPFERPRPNAAEGGDLPAGGPAQPRETQGSDGGGAESPVRGEPDRRGPAGGEAPAAGPAPTDRGEKLGPPAETLGGPHITAYHGSHYDFDKFTLRRTGSGEGTQAFGHGVYLAENPKIAEHYRKSAPIHETVGDVMAAREAIEALKNKTPEDALNARARDFIKGARDDFTYFEKREASPEELAKYLEDGLKADEGIVYQLRVKAERDALLDWEKSLSGQSIKVREALSKLLPEMRADATGESIYRELSIRMQGDEAASKALNDAGVSGLQFLDRRSRGKGEGTRNMVIFDPNLVEITSKNGKQLNVEPGAEGKPQMVLPGAERESAETAAARQRGRDKEEAEARMRGRKRSGVGQESAEDLALFGGERQKDWLGREIPEDGDLQAIAQRRKGGKMAGEQDRVATAQGEPPSPEQDVAIRSLQQQATDLAEALDFPLREGRVGSRTAAGTFNRRSGVVRVREVPDFDVVSHEAGHAIESKIGADMTALTNANAGELRLLDYDPSPTTGQRVNEGFAEYVRLLMTNPAYARNRAPGFDTQFRSFMAAREPEMLAKIDAAAAAYKAYLDAPSVDAVGSVRRSVDEDQKGLAKVVEHVRADGLPLVVKSWVQKSYDAILDDKAPVARAVRELGIAIRERTGGLVDLNAADNPEILMRMLTRARQAATRDLMDGVRPHLGIVPEGPALADAISEAIGKPSVWGKWDEAGKADFDTYLIARRAELLWRKFDAGEIPNPPVAFSRADAQMAMADLEAAMPNFRNASDMVHEYNRQLLKKSFEGGLIDADLHDKLTQEEFYVPFMRDMSDKPNAGSGMGGAGEGPGLTQIVKRLRGSSRDIKSPLESIMAQTFMVNRTLRHNDVVKAFVDLAKQAGLEGGKYVEVIPAHEAKKYTADLEQAITNRAKELGMQPTDLQNILTALGDPAGGPMQGSYFKMEQAAARGEPIVFYREGGQLKAARFMSEKEGHGLYELLTAAPEPVTDLWVQMIGAASSIKRAGIVTNPAFAITNYFRDQVAASILRSDYIPLVSGAKGIVDEFRQGNSAVLYGYAGGVSGGASTGPVERAFENEINAMAKKGYAVNRLTSWKGLLELSSFTEAGTRNSIFDTVFKASKRKGLSDYEAMVEAAFQAQDLLDFSRHGSRTMAIRNLLPFVNAHMQGLDKARRTLIEPITNRIRNGEVFTKDSVEFNNALAAWTKAGAIGGALGAVWAAINSDSEAYRDASPYFKGTHIVIPWGNKIVVAPKPFELGMGFTFGESAYAFLAQKDPRAARQFVEMAWHTVAPPNPITDIPLISTATELALGKSLFTGRDIVPEEQQRKPAEQQFNDRTSELAKWLGKQTGLSPMKIEYGIGAEFGLWGRDVMALSQGVSENSPAASMDDAIFFRRFVKDPTRSSNVITKFWDYMSRTTGRFNQDVAGYNDMVKDAVTRGASMGPANDFLSKMPAAERAFVTLKSGARDDGKAAFTPDERRLHPLQNAYDAVEMLNGLRKEISTNAQMTYGGREKVALNPEQRRLLLEDVRELAQMSMRNALVIVGEAGYANRPVLDPNDTMAKIRHISPVIADEIATRYATAKVYSTEAVRKAWPQLRDRLVQNGTDADIRELSFDAKAEGWQFDGTRTKRPGVIRQKIEGTH